MISDKLFVLGDSIARGVMYDENTSRYTICRDTFDQALKALGVSVKNLSKPGCTSKAALPILDKCEQSDGAVMAIEFGGNDSDLVWKEVAETPDEAHKALVPLEEYGNTLKTLISHARGIGMRPVIVTPLPVVADRYFKWISKPLDESAIMRYLGSCQYIYRWQERYAYAAMEAAREARCPVFDLRSLFLGLRDFESLMSADGIHPNPDGHLFIKNAVLDAWKKDSLNLA